MKKFISAVAMIATSFAFGQINLEHSFPDSNDVFVYKKENTTLYVTKTEDNKIKIYDANYNLQKTVNIPIPSSYGTFYSGYFGANPFMMSKHIFNNDDKYEFMVETYQMGTANSPMIFKLILIDEDGNLIKDFHPTPLTKQSGESFEVYHDNVNNINKLIVRNSVINGNSSSYQHDVYSLPSTFLAAKEIQAIGKLSAFPNPTDKILNIINPANGSNTVNVYDMSGKLVLNKSFSNANNISVNVENLPKGTYIYKIGDMSSKFIKN
jgi:hypothetical protein